MKRNSLPVYFLIFIINALIVFALVVLLFSFFAQQLQSAFPDFYFHLFSNLDVWVILISLIVAVPVTYVFHRMRLAPKRLFYLIGFQLLLLICLLAIIYFNLNLLNRLIWRPLED
ncbi:hypothetical protein [Falsibacillus albus]|uniref:Uncharacterized protein n=1 Tax=Falsibacillus albus TaxID=2478915 RepID=A0A3L7JVP1_9BACI|nr:hypothetical protein [Falsibacillus albus]RLQ94793.1 hypothetical protein D9X91_12420 [Falsibacillus albus]